MRSERAQGMAPLLGSPLLSQIEQPHTRGRAQVPTSMKALAKIFLAFNNWPAVGWQAATTSPFSGIPSACGPHSGARPAARTAAIVMNWGAGKHSPAITEHSPETDDSGNGGSGDGGGGIIDRDSANGDSADSSGANISEDEDERNATEVRKKILIIMSETGGGHMASALAIKAALEDLYPGKLNIEVIDIWTNHARWPFNKMVESYTFMGKHPWTWKVMYEYARFPPTRWFTERWVALSCWGPMKRLLQEEDPSMIISVHPLCQTLPLTVTNFLHGGAAHREEHTPFVTVVTDLGECHPTWFNPKVDTTFVPSDTVEDLAKRLRVPEEKLRKHGLPIRPGFKARDDIQKDAVREELGLQQGVRTALVVGGGDGIGRIGPITKELANEMAADGSAGQLVIVCGKNKVLKSELESFAWPESLNVSVRGFASNMNQLMGAADAVVTKAGPGTIAEACASGLPIMLTSFLPGQEAGNVPFVVDGGFGAYSKQPKKIAKIVSEWLHDPELLSEMSEKSRGAGRPEATKAIAQDLGEKLFPEG